MPGGLVAIHVPPGQQTASLEMPLEISERVGLWVSVLSVLFAAFLLWREKRTSALAAAGRTTHGREKNIGC